MKMKWRRKAEIALRNELEAHPVRIVADAVIATATIGEGRVVPLLILDTTDRPDVEELVRVHEHLPPGDVRCQWCDVNADDGKINLLLRFERPAELAVILEFDVVRQGVLVDQILTAKIVYIQAGRDGDRFSTTMNNSRILVEIPDTGFGKEWDDMFQKNLAKDLRSRGLNRQQAKIAAQRLIQEWRQFSRFRMKRS